MLKTIVFGVTMEWSVAEVLALLTEFVSQDENLVFYGYAALVVHFYYTHLGPRGILPVMEQILQHWQVSLSQSSLPKALETTPYVKAVYRMCHRYRTTALRLTLIRLRFLFLYVFIVFCLYAHWYRVVILSGLHWVIIFQYSFRVHALFIRYGYRS